MRRRDIAGGALTALLYAAGMAFTLWPQLAQAAPSPKPPALLDCSIIDQSTCPALIEAFKDRPSSTRALLAWLALSDNADTPTLRKAGQAIAMLGRAQDAPPLMHAAEKRKAHPAAAVELLAAAARLGYQPAADPLLTALTRKDQRTQVVAAAALGLLKEKRALPALIAKLEAKQTGRVQAASAQALGLIGETEAIAPLIAFASRPKTYPPALATALDALLSLQAQDALPLATQLVDHPERIVGRAALRLLAAMPTPYTLPAIAFALKTPGLRGEAAHAAVALKAKTLGPLLMRAAEDPSLGADEHTWVLHALGVFKPQGAAPALLRRFKTADKAMRLDILKTLPEIGDRTVVPALVPLLHLQEREVANYVVYALENLTGERLGGDERAWRKHLGLTKPIP